MRTYANEDFERITAAIGKDIADVKRHEKAFEAAAMWYRLNSNPPIGERITPFRMGRRMTQIAGAAERLLKSLGVSDPADAPDGPALAVLDVLASTEDGSEDAVIRATARLGRLVELFEAINATRELGHLARQGAADVERLGKLTVLKGHHGNHAENDWIAEMMSLYQQITGNDARTSVGGPLADDEGTPGGPLIRFLKAAGKPIGVEYSPHGWRSRVRVVQKGAPCSE